MQLSLSVRVAEAPTKDRLNVPLHELAWLAQRCGYAAVCMRASAVGVQTPPDELRQVRRMLDGLGLAVSMVTTDYDVPLNNERGPNNLRDFPRHLDVAHTLGASLIRVCMKNETDYAAAQYAADQALERNIRIAHQCHTDSLFETVSECLEGIRRVRRENFGLIYEPANLLLCGQSYTGETLARLAPHLMNVYLQNHRLDPHGPDRLRSRVRGDVRFHDIPIWEPDGVDFDAVFDGLRAVGYHGTVTVHQQFAKFTGPKEAAEKSYAFLAPRCGIDDPHRTTPE